MNEPKDYEYLLLCDGSTISEENYPELVAVLGGTQLPNLINRFLQGSATAGTYKAAGLPNIEGSFKMTRVNASNISTGAFSNIWNETNSDYNVGNNGVTVFFTASKSNTIYGNSTTVQPPALTMLPIIKY